MSLPFYFRQPARIAFYAWLRALRMRAARSLAHTSPGSVTVVTVTWNTLDYLKVCTDMVARHSPDVAHLVVDNHSIDSTREWALAKKPFRYFRLPRNVGHSLALDVGFLLARTEYVVALDVDAFPIRSGWLDPLIQPLRSGAKVSGGAIDNPAISYPYIHPCCLAIRRADFVRDNISFWPADVDSDVGAEISKRYANSLHKIPVTSAYGPGLIGSVFGDVVYHNWGSTRPGLHDTAPDAWTDAVDRFVRPLAGTT